MKHLKKFNESVVDLDAYDVIMNSNTFKEIKKYLLTL